MKKIGRLKLPHMKEHVILAPYTSFKIGGPARYFVEATNDDEAVRAIEAAHSKNIPIFILGGGTNLLISDRGFPGLVVRFSNDALTYEDSRVIAGAGILLQKVIDASIDRGLGGIEMMSGIGGTLGGAVRGNAGAFGQSIGERVVRVAAYENGRVRHFLQKDCFFQYRGSIFKQRPIIILSVELCLVFGDAQALRAKAVEILKKRNEKYNTNWQCAGCVFKNIELQKVAFDRKKALRALDVTEEEFREVTKFGKLPVSFIIDKLGLKGKTMGGAQVAQEHGAFIINTGNARAEDVVMLMSYIKTKVRNLLGIQLEEEIQLVGF